MATMLEPTRVEDEPLADYRLYATLITKDALHVSTSAQELDHASEVSQTLAEYSGKSEIPADEPILRHPDGVTYLDLGCIQSAVESIWTTGRLPQWLRHLKNVEILRAQNLGLIVLDPWIAELDKLRVIDLRGNRIGTWPNGVAELPKLAILRLEGNPVVKCMAQKSPTMKCEFNNDATPRMPRSVLLSRYLVGPEWTAASARNIHSEHEGIYSGGIYSLAEKPENCLEDALTPLDPCPLQERLEVLRFEPTSMPRAAIDNDPEYTRAQMQEELANAILLRKSRLVMELLQDASVLSGASIPQSEPPPVTMSCEAITPWHNISDTELLRNIEAFVLQEGLYIGKLSEVIQLFFGPRVKAAHAKKLHLVFEGFPELYTFHSKSVLPIFNRLVDKLKAGLQGSSEFRQEIQDLLDGGKFESYSHYGARYITSIWTLWQYTRPNVGEVATPFGDWLKETAKLRLHSMSTAYEYLLLPFARLAEFQRFFSSLVYKFPDFAEISGKFREARNQTSNQIFRSRKSLRTKRLASHYNVKEHSYFLQYTWDSLLDVRARSYLEEPRFSYRTGDLIVKSEQSERVVSMVHEIFSSNVRQVRIVCNNQHLQLWDEKIMRLIGTLQTSDIVAHAADGDSLRLYFPAVSETCQCDIISFSSVTTLTGYSDKEKFLLACSEFGSSLFESENIERTAKM